MNTATDNKVEKFLASEFVKKFISEASDEIKALTFYDFHPEWNEQLAEEWFGDGCDLDYSEYEEKGIAALRELCEKKTGLDYYAIYENL